MSKKQHSAAIVGLLDAIKSEGITPVSENSFSDSNVSSIRRESKTLLDPINNKKINYTVETIDPQKCTVWRLANRLSEYINDDSCKDLIDSIQIVGQQIPAISRPLGNGRYELICGARRLYVCKKLGITLLTAIIEISDQDALLLMDAENRPREDISPYERALDYSNWIKSGFFKNQQEIARAIGFQNSWFSKLMSLASLDPIIIHAFGHPSKLKQLWGYNLYQLCASSPTLKKLILNKAETLATSNLPSEQIYKELCSLTENKSVKPESQTHWVTNNNNVKLFKLTKNSKGKMTLTFTKAFSQEKINDFIEKMKEISNEYC